MCGSSASSKPDEPDTEGPEEVDRPDIEDAPDAPDRPDGRDEIIASAQNQYDIGQDYLNFAKDQFNISQDRLADIDATANIIGQYFQHVASTDRGSYEKYFKGIEETFAKNAATLGSQEHQDAKAAEAKADVSAEIGRARDADARSRFGLGIRPDSGAFLGRDRAFSLAGALGSVDAQQKAREAARNEAATRQLQAVGIGQTTASRADSASAQGDDAGLAANQQFLDSQSIYQEGFDAAQEGAEGQSETLQNLYSTDAQLYATDREANSRDYATRTSATTDMYDTDVRASTSNYATRSNADQDAYRTSSSNWQTELDNENKEIAGLMEGVGTGIGTYAALSDKKAKKDRKKVPEGKALEAVEKMPVETYRYKEGAADGGAEPHVGPMAQDFKEATRSGDGRTIDLQDAIGVTMKAVQDLSAKVDRLAQAIGVNGKSAAA